MNIPFQLLAVFFFDDGRDDKKQSDPGVKGEDYRFPPLISQNG